MKSVKDQFNKVSVEDALAVTATSLCFVMAAVNYKSNVSIGEIPLWYLTGGAAALGSALSIRHFIKKIRNNKNSNTPSP